MTAIPDEPEPIMWFSYSTESTVVAWHWRGMCRECGAQCDVGGLTKPGEEFSAIAVCPQCSVPHKVGGKLATP